MSDVGLGVTMDASVWVEVREDEEKILDMVQELLWYQDKEEEDLFVQRQDTISYGSWLYIYTYVGRMFTMI